MDPFIQNTLIVGFISLLSTSLGFFLKYLFDSRTNFKQLKSFSLQKMVYKQIEYFDKLAPILSELNMYITSINVYLGDDSEFSQNTVAQLAHKNTLWSSLFNLTDNYYFYIPSNLYKVIDELINICLAVRQSPSHDTTDKAIEKLFEVQNKVRLFVGSDKLSEDLLKSISSKDRKQLDQ